MNLSSTLLAALLIHTDWVRDFREHLDKSQPNGLSEAVVAIKTLLQLIKNSEGDILCCG